jgi:titin
MGDVIAVAPGQVTQVHTAYGNCQVTVSWSPPADLGGSVILGYRLYRSDSFDGTYSLIASPSIDTHIDTGLVNGQVHWYKVSAVNVIGEGPMSAAASGTALASPSAPTRLAATPGNGQVVLSWQAPLDNGGSNVSGYRVYRALVSGGVYTLIAATASLGHVDTELLNGQVYWYKVSAVNSVQEGIRCSAASATPCTLPGAPTGLVAVAGSAKAYLNWTAPSSTGGMDIDYYIVYQDGVAMAEHSTGLSTVVSNLINGRAYVFAVSAHNAAGEGPASANASATPTVSVPSSPRSVTASVANGKVMVAWLAPSSTGGADVVRYNIYRSDSVAGPFEQIASSAATALNHTDGTAREGQTYWYKVSAVNSAGEGAQSFYSKVVTPSSPPADNTLLYICIAGVAVAAGVVGFLFWKRRR